MIGMIIRPIITWLSKNSVIVMAIISVLACLSGLGSCVLSKRQLALDSPKLFLSLDVGSPEYSEDEGKTWQPNVLESKMGELMRLQFAVLTAPTYVSNSLVAREPEAFFSERIRQCQRDMQKLLMRVPLRMTVANNGHRDTTLVGGRLTVTGYDNPAYRSGNFDGANLFLPEGTVTSLTNCQALVFKSPEDAPKLLIVKAMCDGMKSVMAGFDPRDSDWQKKFPGFLRFIMESNSPEMLKTPQAKVCVEFVDQRGITCKAEAPICDTAPFIISNAGLR